MSPIFFAIIAAVGYSLIFFLKSNQNGEPFILSKFIATLLVSGGVGVYFHIKHIEITEAGILAKLALMGGVIIIVENVLKVIWRYIKKILGKRQ